MRDDVEAPLLEVGDLVLRLADDDLDDRLIQPLRLALRAWPPLRAARRARLRPLPPRASACFASQAARTCAAFAFQRGMMRWCIRAQVILSMQTNIDLPDSHRVAQCSTKSAAILSSRSSAVMTS